MKKFRSVIDRLERGLLGWTRTIITIAVSFLLLGGSLTLYSSLAGYLASADVTLADDIDRVEFKEPGIRNVTEEPEHTNEAQNERQADSASMQRSENRPSNTPYGEEIADIVESLLPLMDALEFNASRMGLRNYVKSRVNMLDGAIGQGMRSVDSEVAKAHLDDAVDGMVEYVDELADFYGDEIELDTSESRAEADITPEFKRHLQRVLQDPLAPYVEEVKLAVADLANSASLEANRVAEARADARKSLESLIRIAVCLLGGILLLLVFRVEWSLRQHATAVTEASAGRPVAETGSATAG